jgi:hypothetical protein
LAAATKIKQSGLLFYEKRYQLHLFTSTTVMKYLAILLLVSLAVVFSCTTDSGSNSLFSIDNLPLQQYTIQTERDTVLYTQSGALLDIPKGSLVAENGNSVLLEIREAYTLEQIIKARLLTQSNGQPLSSGGMIYINAAKGQKASIKKGIRVAIPTNFIAEGMQLYKGNLTDSGMNWTDPVSIPKSDQAKAIDEGKVLFMQSCASCHKIGQPLTGPDLAHFDKRSKGDDYWRYALHYQERIYTGSPAQIPANEMPRDTSMKTLDEKSDFGEKLVIGNGQPYYCNLYKMFGNANGTAFPALGKAGLDKIYRYIQNESERLNLPLPKHAWLKDCTDSCAAYTKATRLLQKKKESVTAEKAALVKNNGKMVKEIRNNTPVNGGGSGPSQLYDDLVSPAKYDASYYQFTIETFGWYNIDVLLTEFNGSEESELFVQLSGSYREKTELFLIIPSATVYTEGGKTDRAPDEYAFAFRNGKIFLPQGVKACIMAVSETSSSVAYAIREFTTGTSQRFEITLTEGTKESFTAAVAQFSGADISVKVKDAKNADAIRQADKEIDSLQEEMINAEKMKPQGCDCNCTPSPAAPVAAESPK